MEGIDVSMIFTGEETSISNTEFKEYLKEDHLFILPELNSENFPISIPMARISFTVEKEKVEAVMETMNVRKNKEVGAKCFQYYYDREILTDE